MGLDGFVCRAGDRARSTAKTASNGRHREQLLGVPRRPRSAGGYATNASAATLAAQATQPRRGHSRLASRSDAVRWVHTTEEIVIEAVARAHAELLAGGETTYVSARIDCARDAAHAIAIVRQKGYSERALRALDELIDGAADWFGILRSSPRAA